MDSDSSDLLVELRWVSISLKVKNWNLTLGSLLLLKISFIYFYFRIFFVLILSRLMLMIASTRLGSTICIVVSEGSINQILCNI